MKDKVIITEVTNIGDPYILVDNDTYYMYATSFKDGFKVWSSKDLVNWKDEGLCYYDSKVGYKDFWAPEVIKKDGKYYMFFTSRNKELDRLMLSVAISDSPLGRFNDVSDKHVFDFGYAAIDATVYKDDDGRYYMYYSRDCSENVVDGIHASQIYVVELDQSLLKTIGEPKMILTPSGSWEAPKDGWAWNEGPYMLKYDNKYYLSYSTNFYASKEYSVCYAVSDQPMGEFVKAKENPILKYTDKMSGPGHNCYFESLDKELLTAFHIHTYYDKPSGNRRACFAKAMFVDGKLVIDYL